MNIDKLQPIVTSLNIINIDSGFAIEVEANDADATEEYAQSGIDYIEYYITDANKKTTQYATKEITGLPIGSYQVYVVVYDKAGNSVQSETIEKKVAIRFDKIFAGKYAGFGLDKEGRLFGWGMANTIELENGYLNTNKPIQLFEGMEFKELAPSDDQYLAIDKEDNLWAWGRNTYGELGNGSSQNAVFPIQKIQEGMKFKEIAVIQGLSKGIDQEGNLFSWGACYLGDGTNKTAKLPLKIQESTKFRKIKVGGLINNYWNHSVAIDENGDLWTWGNNSFCELGNGTMQNSKVPVKISQGIKFKEISTAEEAQCTFAIDEEGNLWAWGYNAYGQLGIGTTENYANIPTKIAEGTKFKTVSTGYYYSVAIDEEGNLWSWGYNNQGQLGNGTTKDSNIPTKVQVDAKFKSVSAGYDFCLAIDENGTLWAWGMNLNGQFGNGTTKNSRIPIKVNE